MRREAAGFIEVWSLDKKPVRYVPVVATQGICPQAPRLPTAYGTSDGRIVIEIPVMVDPLERTIPNEIYSFAWDGKTYRLQDEQSN